MEEKIIAEDNDQLSEAEHLENNIEPENKEISGENSDVQWLKDYRKLHGFDKHNILYSFLAFIVLIGLNFALASLYKDASSVYFYSFIGLGIISTITLGFLGYFHVFKPIDEITNYSLRMAVGERGLKTPQVKTRNEISYVAGALTVFHKMSVMDYLMATQTMESEEVKQAEKEARNESVVQDFENSVKRVIDGVVSTTSEAIYATTRTLTEITETSFSQAETLEVESNKSSEKASMVAKSAEELALGILEVNKQIDSSTQLVEEAVRSSDAAGETVNKLEMTANEISDVVQIIDRIANQINLLSLNATIEAARAGEAGKGFAVVASEVKSLARQVSDATGGIAERIDSIQKVTGETVSVMSQIGEASRRISESSKAVAESMQTQSQITQNITDNIRDSYEGIKKVATISHEVSESSHFTKGVVQEMRSITGDITQQSTMLDMQVKSFLSRIRGNEQQSFEVNRVGGEQDEEDVELF
jgi:methyl-accepting chemotaxis protein